MNANLFEVVMDLQDSALSERATFLCSKAQIPGSVPETNIQIIDDGSDIRFAVLAWSNHGDGRDLVLTQYNKDGPVERIWTLTNAVPTVVGPIQLDWSDPDPATYTVKFKYEHCESRGYELLP